MIVPSPASATNTTRSGRRSAASVDRVAVGADRRAGTADAFDQPDGDPAGPLDPGGEVGGGEARGARARLRPSAAPTPAGRCAPAGTRRRRPRRWRAPSTSASVGAPGSPDCTGLRTATVTPRVAQRAGDRGGPPGLAHARCRCRSRTRAWRVGSSRLRGTASASAPARVSTCSGVCAADTVTRNRDGARRRPSGGGSRSRAVPRSSSASAAARARASLPHV